MPIRGQCSTGANQGQSCWRVGFDGDKLTPGVPNGNARPTSAAAELLLGYGASNAIAYGRSE